MPSSRMAKGFGHGTGKDAHPFSVLPPVLSVLPPVGLALGKERGKSLLSLGLHS